MFDVPGELSIPDGRGCGGHGVRGEDFVVELDLDVEGVGGFCKVAAWVSPTLAFVNGYEDGVGDGGHVWDSNTIYI